MTHHGTVHSPANGVLVSSLVQVVCNMCTTVWILMLCAIWSKVLLYACYGPCPSNHDGRRA